MIHTLKVEREVKVIKIALTGKLRSGKDEVAKHLYLKSYFGKVAFGDELKRLYHETFPWIPELPKPRAGYQRYGQLMRHEFDQDVWIRHTERKVNDMISVRVNLGDEKIGVVITDLRQPNEYEWARKSGFTVIRVTAPDVLRIERARRAGDNFTEADLEHETEQNIDSYEVDYEIINDGSLGELKAKVDEVLADIIGVK